MLVLLWRTAACGICYVTGSLYIYQSTPFFDAVCLSVTNLGGSSLEQTRKFLLLLNLSYASDNAWLVDTTSDIILVCLILPGWQPFA